ncbi:hypothetical protein QBC32DRAFT_324347 [Pseudoneurospora amorphoporcata]|uniref:Heme oxygenase-like protein n=1 Tax=Pseudoneurospora amorphoporcata TaxID=241081 RepID=A0AAN6NV89_9PEZI|nr:hypothetical protein QBC32DRAFT_324347 [Pseudoneurospora amorphoporcata]
MERSSPAPQYSHLGDQINAATRSVHTQLNSQIIRRLPLALPPAANTPSTYVSGLLHVAPVYITFETLWYMILLSHKEQTKDFRNPSPYQGRPPSPQPPKEKDRFLLDPKTSHRVPFHDGNDAGLSQRPGTSERIFSILKSLRLPGLMRADCLRADIRCLTGWPKEVVDEQIEVAAQNGNLKKFITQIKQSVGESPHVLLAYAWVLYMALFSGGRILRNSLEKAGPEFWKTKCDPIMPLNKACAYPDKSHATAPMSERLRFFHFNTNQDGEDLKREFKRRLVEAEDLLTTSEKTRIVHEAIHVFENMLALVSQLDHVFLEGTRDDSFLDINVTRPDGDMDTPSPSPGPSSFKSLEQGGRIRDSIVLSKERGVRTAPGLKHHRRSRSVSIDEPFDERGDRSSDVPSPYLVASLLRPMEQGGRLRDSIAISRERGLRTAHYSSHSHSESTSIDENPESPISPEKPESLKLTTTRRTSEPSSPSMPGPESMLDPFTSSTNEQGTLAGAQPSSSSEVSSLVTRNKSVRFKKPSTGGRSSKKGAKSKDSESQDPNQVEAERRRKSSAEKVSPTWDHNPAGADTLVPVPIHIVDVDGSDADDSSDSDKQMKQLQEQQQTADLGEHETISVTITDTAMMETASSSNGRAPSGEESRSRFGTGGLMTEHGNEDRPSLKRSSSLSSSRHKIKSWFSAHFTKVEKVEKRPEDIDGGESSEKSLFSSHITKVEKITEDTGHGATGSGKSLFSSHTTKVEKEVETEDTGHGSISDKSLFSSHITKVEKKTEVDDTGHGPSEVVITETITEAASASTSTSPSALSLKAKMKNKLAHGQDKLKVKMDHAEEKLKRGTEKLKEKSKELSLLAIGPMKFMWKFVFVLGILGAVWGVVSLRGILGWTFLPVTMVVRAAGWVVGGSRGAFAGPGWGAGAGGGNV